MITRAADLERVVLAPGRETPVVPARWRGVLLIVARGALRLRCESGRTEVFPRGSVLYFEGIPLVAMAADGTEATVLVAVRRRPLGVPARRAGGGR
jgi:hypothetical protein